MEDYVTFLNAYKKTNRLNIVLNVFTDDPLNKKLLWLLWISVILLSTASVLLLNKILIMVAMFPAVVGALFYRKELYLTYAAVLSDRIYMVFAKEYALNYQGLRYFLFKKEMGSVDVDEVRHYLDVKLKTKPNKPIRNNWLIAGLITVLAVISNQIISGLSEGVLWLILFFVVVLIIYSIMFLQVFVSDDERDREMLRFLSWFERDVGKNAYNKRGQSL